jgi:hypothetical protein
MLNILRKPAICVANEKKGSKKENIKDIKGSL